VPIPERSKYKLAFAVQSDIMAGGGVGLSWSVCSLVLLSLP
jgi:hypothetical protein